MSLRGFEADFVFRAVPGEGVLRAGAVVLDGAGRVVAAGSATDLRAAHHDAQWQRLPGLLMPGLVNAHVHLELSALRGQTRSGGGFGPWVTSMIEARDRLVPERDLEAIEAAVSELLRHGTVAVGEVSNVLAAVEALGTAPLLGRVFHEVFGMTALAARTMREMAEQQRAAIQRWPAQLSHVLSPHTLFSLHPSQAQALVGAAREAGTVTSLHLAEHAAERAYLADGTGPFAAFLKQRGASPADWSPPALDPVAYAAQLELLGPHLIAVHMADGRRSEFEQLAASGTRLVLCPRSNLFIELKLPPLNLILEAGFEPGLGTDSLASNTTLDVLAEASALRDRFPQVPGETLLRMATRGGAEALGLSHRVGSLEAGLTPGLLQLTCPADAADPAAHVLRYHAEARTVLARPAMPSAARPLEAAP